jgi:hypothetical protein
MDDIVKQAIAKWPNVPHCYGWLALDARGQWRMRDERAQALNLPGDKIVHRALVGFINRNYLHDDTGRWYFQNGPQRVYVTLEATPFIARTDPEHGFVLHTGEPLAAIEQAWLTGEGRLILNGAGKVAMVDDRDIAQCLAMLRLDGAAADDERLLDWLRQPADGATLVLQHAGGALPVRHLDSADIARHFGFIREPRPDTP